MHVRTLRLVPRLYWRTSTFPPLTYAAQDIYTKELAKTCAQKSPVSRTPKKIDHPGRRINRPDGNWQRAQRNTYKCTIFRDNPRRRLAEGGAGLESSLILMNGAIGCRCWPPCLARNIEASLPCKRVSMYTDVLKGWRYFSANPFDGANFCRSRESPVVVATVSARSCFYFRALNAPAGSFVTSKSERMSFESSVRRGEITPITAGATARWCLSHCALLFDDLLHNRCISVFLRVSPIFALTNFH